MIAILATMAKRILKKRLIVFVFKDYLFYSFSESVTLLIRRLGNLFAPISDTQALEYLVDKNRHGNLAWTYYQLVDNKLRLVTRCLYLIYLNVPDLCVKIQAQIAFNCSDFSPNNRRQIYKENRL